MFHPRWLILVSLALWMPGNDAFSSDCADWPNCELALTSNLAIHADFSGQGFVYDSETDHFVFFLQTTSPQYGLVDAGELGKVQDQLECAYRYHTCYLSLTPFVSTEKLQVYIGDVNNSYSRSDSYITLNDSLVSFISEQKVVYTTPVHEFHHLVSPVGDEGIMEGFASLGEQLVSEENLLYSYQRFERRGSFHSPSFDLYGSYGRHVFWRFLFEQLKGMPACSAAVEQDWGVSDYLQSARDESFAGASDSRALMEAVFAANVSSSSLVSSSDELMANYMTMRYAFRYVKPQRQPEYFFFVGKRYLSSIDLDLTLRSDGNVLSQGSSVTFENVTVNYNAILPFNGFNGFLGAEYHQLNPDLSGPAAVGNLQFDNNLPVPDPDIKHQLIVRYPQGVEVHQLLESGTTEVVPLRSRGQIRDVIFVAYTVNTNPYTNATGRVFDVTITALP